MKVNYGTKQEQQENRKKFTLPRRFAEKWLEALRRGKYKRTICELYSRVYGGYCCLGVAGRVVGIEAKDLKGDFPKDCGKQLKLKYPLAFFKTEKRNGISDLSSTLAEMNDEGWSFKQIARWIELNVRFR